MHQSTRRSFLKYSMAGTAGLTFASFPGCASPPAVDDGIRSVPVKGYPLVEAEGSHREIGYTLGSAMKDEIREYFDFSAQYSNCTEYLWGDGEERVLAMHQQAKAYFPQYVEELEGMAEGLEMPYMPLFAYNCRSEIGILRQPSGCSTLALREGGQAVLAHNEDGLDLNVGRLYVARVKPPSKMTFIAFVYPGLLPGNGPGINKAGIVQTTNYIAPPRVADGVPRYFIGRAVMEAGSLDSAVALATIKDRAFPWHHNLVSLSEGRILSVETFPGRHNVKEVEGCYVHTNHLVHPEMKRQRPEDRDIPYPSSTTRYRVLTQAIVKDGEPHNGSEMVKLLSLHEGSPYSPCRHPKGDVHGATLGTAVFQAPERAMTLYHGNPCRKVKKKYVL